LILDYCFQCFDDTEKLQWEHIESEWKQEKQKALNALAGTSEEFLNLSLQPEVKKEFFMYRTQFWVISNQSITSPCHQWYTDTGTCEYMLLISCSGFQKNTESSCTIILYFMSTMLVLSGELLANRVSAHHASG